MSSPKWIRLGGLAVVLGGILTAALAILTFHSHGPTESNRKEVVLGLISEDYTRLSLIPILLLLLGLMSLNARQAVYHDELRRAGYLVALGGHGLASLGRFFSYWAFPFVDYADPNFYLTPLPQTGFRIELLAMLLIPSGMLMFGFAILKSHALPRWNALPLIIGVLSLSLLISWFWSYGGIVGIVLYGLAWVAQGYVLWSIPGQVNRT
jgi:hypothetical protein